MYNELLQRNAIIADLRFLYQVFSFEFESYSTFAVQKCLLYTRHRSYDSFVVSVTHFLRSRSSAWAISRLTWKPVCFFCPEVSVCTYHQSYYSFIVSIAHTSQVNIQHLAPSKTVSQKFRVCNTRIAFWLQMERSEWSRHIPEFGTTHCIQCYQTSFRVHIGDWVTRRMRSKWLVTTVSMAVATPRNTINLGYQYTNWHLTLAL